jgi:hypothetical protein
MFRNTLLLIVLIALSLSSSHLFAAVQKTIGTSDTSGELTLQEFLPRVLPPLHTGHCQPLLQRPDMIG